MSEFKEIISGMTWGWTGVRGTWGGKEAEHSMKQMAELNVNWTAISFSALQDHPQATEIKFREEPTVTDGEVRWAIHHAKKLGLKIILKPVVNCHDGTWRAHINFFDKDVPCEPKWSEWFASYLEFILHYAKLAEETSCEMLCIGCEMVQTDRRETDWRDLIDKVRKVYSGLITYNCDKYQEDNVKWWDAVDIISSSGYYPINDWEAQLSRIEKVVKSHQMPFFFMETGCPSRSGSSYIPNDWGLQGEANEDEQDLFFKTMFDACKSCSWVLGYVLWDWPAKLYKPEEAITNSDYCIYGKKAENTVREFYKMRG